MVPDIRGYYAHDKHDVNSGILIVSHASSARCRGICVHIVSRWNVLRRHRFTIGCRRVGFRVGMTPLWLPWCQGVQARLNYLVAPSESG